MNSQCTVPASRIKIINDIFAVNSSWRYIIIHKGEGCVNIWNRKLGLVALAAVITGTLLSGCSKENVAKEENPENAALGKEVTLEMMTFSHTNWPYKEKLADLQVLKRRDRHLLQGTTRDERLHHNDEPGDILGRNTGSYDGQQLERRQYSRGERSVCRLFRAFGTDAELQEVSRGPSRSEGGYSLQRKELFYAAVWT